MKNIIFFLLTFINFFFVHAQTVVSGKVFFDNNNNTLLDKGEKGLKGVLVSNGKDIVKTDKYGNYKIVTIQGNKVFVIKPSQYISPLLENRPQFFLSQNDIKNQVYHFPLQKHKEPKNLNITLLGDPQVDIIDDVHHVDKLVTQELNKEDVDFIIPLGDLTFDNHDMFAPLSASLGLIGAPVFNVMGNHDQNYNAKHFNDRDADFEKFFGPSYYAYEFGSELCLVLNNIYPKGDKGYVGKLDEDQYVFVNEVLNQMKQKHQSIYVFMHIPLEEMEDHQRVLNLFKAFPEVMIVAGHTHTQYQKSFARENLPAVKELVAGAVCGSWWQGPHDSNHIPFAFMYDGTPKGYWFLNTDKNHLTYKVSGRAKDFQIEITVPERNEWDTALNDLNDDYIYANVFAGSENTTVQISYDGDNWFDMEKYNSVAPKLKQLYKLQQEGRFKGQNISAMPIPKTISDHLWRIKVPKKLQKGTYLILVKAKDDETGLDVLGKRVLRISE